MTLSEARDNWSQRLAFAQVKIGLSADEFWNLTPRQNDHYVKQWKSGREHDDFMIAQLTAVTANFSMYRRKQGYSAFDFMPSRRESQPKPRLNRKRIADHVRTAMNALMAESGS